MPAIPANPSNLRYNEMDQKHCRQDIPVLFPATVHYHDATGLPGRAGYLYLAGTKAQ